MKAINWLFGKGAGAEAAPKVEQAARHKIAVSASSVYSKNIAVYTAILQEMQKQNLAAYTGTDKGEFYISIPSSATQAEVKLWQGYFAQLSKNIKTPFDSETLTSIRHQAKSKVFQAANVEGEVDGVVHEPGRGERKEGEEAGINVAPAAETEGKRTPAPVAAAPAKLSPRVIGARADAPDPAPALVLPANAKDEGKAVVREPRGERKEGEGAGVNAAPAAVPVAAPAKPSPRVIGARADAPAPALALPENAEGKGEEVAREPRGERQERKAEAVALAPRVAGAGVLHADRVEAIGSGRYRNMLARPKAKLDPRQFVEDNTLGAVTWDKLVEKTFVSSVYDNLQVAWDKCDNLNQLPAFVEMNKGKEDDQKIFQVAKSEKEGVVARVVARLDILEPLLAAAQKRGAGAGAGARAR